MFNLFTNLFKPATDMIEANLLKHFDYLLSNYGFEYSKEMLGDARDKNGEFFFYGPLNAYQFYNKNVCITILHLVQRDDYTVFITDKKSDDQVYIQNGTKVPSDLAYDIPLLASEIEESILNRGEIFEHKI